MKKILSFFVMVAAVFALHSQTVIFEDNFDSYTAGIGLVAQNSTNWAVWENPGKVTDPLISTDQAQSTPNSVFITGDNDIIFQFQNQTTGVYKLEFDYYVPSANNGAYFNIQKFATPGKEWACEIFFRPNGTGYMLAGTTSTSHTTFTYPTNQWFHIVFDMDLNNDAATFTVNGTVVRTWPFHYTAQSQTGTNAICQLGSVNFYAGAPGNAIGTYYLDNFKAWEITPPTPGQFVIDPEEPIIIDVHNYGTKTINLSNPGAAPINYEVVAVYDIPEPNPASTGIKPITHYAVQNSSGIVWGETTTQITVASGYTPETLKNHIGKTVRQFDVYIERVHKVTAAKLCIWDMGPMGLPSLAPPIYEQDILSYLADGPNSFTLNVPWLIDGRYFYIGVDLTVIPSSIQSEMVLIGVDATPVAQCTHLGRLIRSSVAWHLLNETSSDGSALNGVWDMTIYVDGTPITPWMLLDHSTATLQPNASKDLKITFGTPSITENCTKKAELYFFSTDFYKEETILDVTANFTIGDVPVIAVTPTSIEKTFAEDAEVKTFTETLTVTNSGTAEGTYAATVPTIAWLTLEGDVSGAVAAGGNKTFDAVIDATGIAIGNYETKISVTTNDFTHALIEIPCKLIIKVGIEVYINGIETKVYPNPATDAITVESNVTMSSVQIINHVGQVVSTTIVNGELTTVNTSNLSAGYYFVKVNTDNGSRSIKFIVK